MEIREPSGQSALLEESAPASKRCSHTKSLNEDETFVRQGFSRPGCRRPPAPLAKMTLEARRSLYANRHLVEALAQLIDPDMAEVSCIEVDPSDPYGIRSKRFNATKLECFAQNSPTKPWIWFGDLSRRTTEALLARIDL